MQPASGRSGSRMRRSRLVHKPHFDQGLEGELHLAFAGQLSHAPREPRDLPRSQENASWRFGEYGIRPEVPTRPLGEQEGPTRRSLSWCLPWMGPVGVADHELAPGPVELVLPPCARASTTRS